MAACFRCGEPLVAGADICASCGIPLGSRTAARRSALASNVAGALTYALGFITGILFLAVEPYKHDRFVRFHAFQAIFFDVTMIALCLVMMIFWVVWIILAKSLGFIPFALLGIVTALFSFLISVAMLGYWSFLMYKAYNNEKFMLPVIGKLAEQQAAR